MHVKCSFVLINFVEHHFRIVVVWHQDLEVTVPGSSLRHRALCAISRGKNSFIRPDAISTVPIMANLGMSFPCAFDVSA